MAPKSAAKERRLDERIAVAFGTKSRDWWCLRQGAAAELTAMPVPVYRQRQFGAKRPSDAELPKSITITPALAFQWLTRDLYRLINDGNHWSGRGQCLWAMAKPEPTERCPAMWFPGARACKAAGACRMRSTWMPRRTARRRCPLYIKLKLENGGVIFPRVARLLCILLRGPPPENLTHAVHSHYEDSWSGCVCPHHVVWGDARMNRKYMLENKKFKQDAAGEKAKMQAEAAG